MDKGRAKTVRPCFFVLQAHKLASRAEFAGETALAESDTPLLIKRYASRRLYNTETSDYVTLDDIAAVIRSGREVQIVDLKSGDDLTRQYLLQIIAEHESRGENMLPVNVLNDLVRSYTSQATSMVPQFLATSFEMLRESQNKMMEQMPDSPMQAMMAQQEAFMKAMSGGFTGWTGGSAPEPEQPKAEEGGEDLADIKKQLADLQEKLSKLS
jgi:polyhydroxyalkanoate synthesis repressor PhaR